MLERAHLNEIIVWAASSPFFACLIPFAECGCGAVTVQRFGIARLGLLKSLAKEAQMSRKALRATKIAMGMSAVLRGLTAPLKFEPFGMDEPVTHFSGGGYRHSEEAEQRRLERP